MAPDLEESFDTFVRTRGGHFLRFAVLLTGSMAEAEDLLQASLTQALPGVPVASVADLLGISAGTVKSQAHRGLRALRASLSPPGPVEANESAGSNGAKG